MEDDLVMLGHPGLELHLGHADQSVRQGRAALPPHGRPPADLLLGLEASLASALSLLLSLGVWCSGLCLCFTLVLPAAASVMSRGWGRNGSTGLSAVCSAQP